MSDNYFLKLYHNTLKYPFGRTIFSKLSAAKAPYFKSISPCVTILEPGLCEVTFKKTKKVQNHIGTVHVIAICNGLEMAMGFMAEASIPKHLRWIPKGMDVNYTAKAGTDMRCVAELPGNEWKIGDLPVNVKCYDTNDNVVVEGTIKLWVSEKPKKD